MTVAAVSYGSQPIVEAAGGPGGPGGPGGAGGPKGTMSDGNAGARGAAGAAGRPGAAGASNVATLNEDQYWARVAAELSSSAATWPAYRQTAGAYYCRRYNPGISARGGDLQFAVNEFQAALRLAPGLAETARLRENVWQNNNVLGFRPCKPLARTRTARKAGQVTRSWTPFSDRGMGLGIYSVFHHPDVELERPGS